MLNYAEQVANDLLAIGAVKFSPEKPFTWASGIKSPIYTDNRMTIGYPKVRQNIYEGLAALIQESFDDVEIIGGVATAGIPHAAWVSEKLNKPMIYVRSKPKDHGAGRQTEGAVIAGKKVVLIDDLISTGGSVLSAAEAIRKEGANVLGVVSIFSYELSEGLTNFTNAKLTFKSLTTYSQLVAAAIERGDLNKSQLTTLQNWQQNPNKWQL
ncbi:MAG: orotate phosphoribosyltransferase [Leuconostoc gelidum]|jgi:orotate phosphoribosyltransferase|uniref:Orotate phosphoribosyltransferase n=1 Tax=Leuconostoc gelidum subsp. gelidum TaxID=1607839 RepID=A0ABS7V3U6_LEUGE|nr:MULTISPECIES: orotate phosphoribosyltransferase [Leuconostoc gelidum group]AFS40304.1 orotate phosphoribosyltransferase [Leuconostoc gelidum JB7]MBZ5960900.1 orotate phosphoribosyltransferase [Leuconostoc gasicomitatum]MBZ5963480.1 orotate phosphoribosyltransferase [Leuconostoc gelidum subsp. gelidum]MBZ5975678.1 orotate phosphoribosyltransferase [Leuconostoc gelidum subsp. gelidum]MBZ5976154.1 orotate phosphoribosyltransferase [Leuconostoc gelidum subsp. gelidum]